MLSWKCHYHKRLPWGKKCDPSYTGVKDHCTEQLPRISTTWPAGAEGRRNRSPAEAAEGSFWQVLDVEWLYWGKLAKHHVFHAWERDLSKLRLLSRGEQAELNTQKELVINCTTVSAGARWWTVHPEQKEEMSKRQNQEGLNFLNSLELQHWQSFSPLFSDEDKDGVTWDKEPWRINSVFCRTGEATFPFQGYLRHRHQDTQRTEPQ